MVECIRAKAAPLVYNRIVENVSNVSTHELIADVFSEILSLWLDSHMSQRDIFPFIK